MISIFCQLARNGSCFNWVKWSSENNRNIIFKCNCRSYITSCVSSYRHHKSKNSSTIFIIQGLVEFYVSRFKQMLSKWIMPYQICFPKLVKIEDSWKFWRLLVRETYSKEGIRGFFAGIGIATVKLSLRIITDSIDWFWTSICFIFYFIWIC